MNDNIIILDSISFANPGAKGRIIICGSHGGLVAAQHAAQFQPKCVFFNDAGKGKRDAGVTGLFYLDELSIIAAAVDTMTAMIGVGADSYENGIISTVNTTAVNMGLKKGMTVKQAVEVISAKVPVSMK